MKGVTVLLVIALASFVMTAMLIDVLFGIYN
jgi:hypothetical protein